MREPAGHSSPGAGLGGPVGAIVLAGGMLGALLLFVGEFTTLSEIHTASSPGPVRSVGTGSHHAYAIALIAIVAGVFAVGAWRGGSRPALLAVGLLGVVALLISLLGDLPDANATGLIGTSSTHYELARATPSAGIYMQTLGAAVLIISSASAFILLGPPSPLRSRPARGGPPHGGPPQNG